MIETTIKIKAKHAIITPICRRNRTVQGAFEEAIERLRSEYMLLNQVPVNQKANFHLVLEVERELPGD